MNKLDFAYKTIANLMTKIQSLTEEIKDLSSQRDTLNGKCFDLESENERFREALKQILNTNSAYFDGQISRMKDIAHTALTQNKQER